MQAQITAIATSYLWAHNEKWRIFASEDVEKRELVYTIDGCIRCFSIAVIKCHDQGNLFGLAVPGEGEFIMEGDTAASGWHSSRNSKLRAHIVKSKHEAGSEQEVGWDSKFPEPTLSGTIPPARLYYLNRSKQSPMCSNAWDYGGGGTFPVQTTTVDTIGIPLKS